MYSDGTRRWVTGEFVSHGYGYVHTPTDVTDLKSIEGNNVVAVEATPAVQFERVQEAETFRRHRETVY
jgi:hypothetical protein